ncbi:YtpI family protein [Alkalihalobacillus sp. 1P02AB]|uniref:YtpI family protein n=1 Tax=Alkalihalobacillus sp. 1P02AB TaxID=3132260 RepID=UPI0039A71436
MADSISKILIIIVVISFVFFLFNKFKQWRAAESLVKRIYQSKASLSLGMFLLAFGLNLFVSYRSILEVVIGAVFVMLGAFNAYHGYKAYNHYIPQMEQN